MTFQRLSFGKKLLSWQESVGRMMPPNHLLQRTAASRRGCNRRASWLPSLSLGR